MCETFAKMPISSLIDESCVVENDIFGGHLLACKFNRLIQYGRHLFDLFTLQESKSFLISIGESRRSFKPKVHSQSFDEVRLKEQFHAEDKQKGGKARLQAMRRFPFSGKHGTSSCPRWRK